MTNDINHWSVKCNPCPVDQADVGLGSSDWQEFKISLNLSAAALKNAGAFTACNCGPTYSMAWWDLVLTSFRRISSLTWNISRVDTLSRNISWISRAAVHDAAAAVKGRHRWKFCYTIDFHLIFFTTMKISCISRNRKNLLN